MNRRLLFLAVVPALIASACTTDPDRRADADFEGTWAGAAWRGDAHWTILGDTLFLGGASPPNSMMPAEYVSVRVVYTGVGTYVVEPGDGTFNYLVGGDVLTSRYASTAGSGTLVIEAVQGNVLVGTVTFDAVSVMEHAPAGAESRFEGAFTAQRVTIQ